MFPLYEPIRQIYYFESSVNQLGLVTIQCPSANYNFNKSNLGSNLCFSSLTVKNTKAAVLKFGLPRQLSLKDADAARRNYWQEPRTNRVA